MNSIQLYLNYMNAIHLHNNMQKQKKFNRNKEEKIEEIMENFSALIKMKGYNKIKMLDIAHKSKLSVGTIYRYFPNGKNSILKHILERKLYNIADFSGFESMNNTNLENNLQRMIYRHLNSHIDDLPYHIAINQAILSNKEFQQEYNFQITDMFKNVSKKIQKSNLYLKNIPENIFLSNMLLIFNTLEAYIHRHLFIRPIFQTDKELVDFLSDIMVKIIIKR